MPHPTPGTSPSGPPTSVASTSPPRAVAFQHFAGHCTSSGVLGAPSLPSPPSVLNSVLPIGPQSSSDSPVTIPDHASSPESHSLPQTPIAPNQSRPRLSSAPSLDVAEEEDSGKATLPEDRDALDPPSSIRDNIIAAPYLSSQPPSPLLVTDVAIAAPSS
ncbi:hypothetical protein EDB84DRAFT_1535641 [Lactarius hengduanensis]|nr:hypothetical protein EDB84DRAFT_1535641 [Lactarius hengduanensis]